MTILLSFLLTGCGSEGEGSAVFAGRDDASALLVQWRNAGNGVLSGSIQVADKFPGATGTAVKQTKLDFSGKLVSDQISLVVTQELGQPQTWNGTLDGDELRLDVPQGLGGVESITLARASASAYKADVEALETAVISSRSEAAKAAVIAEKEAAQREADAATRQAFKNAVSDVSASRETLLALITDPPELAALPADLKAARAHLAQVKSAAAKAALHPRGSLSCRIAAQATLAYEAVAGDASYLEDDVRLVSESADDLIEGRTELSLAYNRMQQLSEHSGQSSKSGAATPGTLLEDARKTAQRWRIAANQADKKIKPIVSTAIRVAERAETTSC